MECRVAQLGVEGRTVSTCWRAQKCPQTAPRPRVSAGAKVRAEIYEAFENIYPILKGFRKTT